MERLISAVTQFIASRRRSSSLPTSSSSIFSLSMPANCSRSDWMVCVSASFSCCSYA